MKILDLLDEERIILYLNGTTKSEVYNEMVQKLLETGIIDDFEGFLAEIDKRENISSTALDFGICIPHAKTRLVKKPAIVVARSLNGVDCNSMDGEVSKLFFMIAMPENSHNEHIEVLGALTAILLDNNFREGVMRLTAKEGILKLIREKEAEKRDEQNNIHTSSEEFIIAVTACPTGIAHTFMAQEALKAGAKELKVNIKIETNGTDGVKNKLTKTDIEKAKSVILAVDRGIEFDRFAGKKVIQVGTKAAIKDAKGLICQALSGNVPIFKGSYNSADSKDESSLRTGAYKHLMTGVSYMLPFVVSGGILIALAFIFDKLRGVQGGANLGSTTYLAQMFMEIGGAAFALFVPVLGAYIAYSIAGRTAITAGFVGAVIASSNGSGFLGAIAAGFLAGYLAKGIMYVLKGTPKSINGVKAILIYPIVTVLLTGLILILVLNSPIAFIDASLNLWLNNMAGGSKFLLGLVIGGMMSVDMGGPVNKAAYVFSIGTLAASGEYGTAMMAAAMAGGMVAPLGIALATLIFKNRFNNEELEAGKTNIVLGLTFITEGAIPFAAADPFRVIPATIVGSAIAGALVLVFDIYLPVPHGGLVVMFLSNKPFLYMLMVLIGSFVTCFLLALLKKKVV